MAHPTVITGVLGLTGGHDPAGQVIAERELTPSVLAAGLGLGTSLVNAFTGRGRTFETGADIDIVPTSGGNSRCAPDVDCGPGRHWSARHGCCVKTRRRRKRLLTCGDKADISFLTGTLGKGEMAKAAISAVLARCA